jgi:uncharacterized HAD superfamily protein
MFAVDIDGVLANSDPWIVRALEERLGRPLSRDPSVYEAMGIRALIPEEERPAFERAWREVLVDPEVYTRALPYPGALEALLWLHHHRLLRGYVTARPPEVMKATEAWLTEWGFPPVPLVQDRGNRVEAMRLMRAEILVDDHPEKALRVALAGYPVFLMDHAYNRDTRHVGIFRFYSWEGFLDLLKVLPLDTRVRRDPLGWPEKKKGGRRG